MLFKDLCPNLNLADRLAPFPLSCRGAVPGLSAHMLTHAGPVDRFACSTCGKQYSSRKALVFHANSNNPHLLQDGEQNCPYYGCSNFSNLKNKQDHVAYCLHDSEYKGHLNVCFRLMTGSIPV